MNKQEWRKQNERQLEKTLKAWHEWAQHNQISEEVVQFVQDNPDVFAGVETTAEDNPTYSTPKGVRDENMEL
jgi:hypothetical protein